MKKSVLCEFFNVTLITIITDLCKLNFILLYPTNRCDFIGTLIVVPDVGSINMPGARAESNARHKGEESEGLRGLKSLGVRDLHHRMAFLVTF